MAKRRRIMPSSTLRGDGDRWTTHRAMASFRDCCLTPRRLAAGPERNRFRVNPQSGHKRRLRSGQYVAIAQAMSDGTPPSGLSAELGRASRTRPHFGALDPLHFAPIRALELAGQFFHLRRGWTRPIERFSASSVFRNFEESRLHRAPISRFVAATASRWTSPQWTTRRRTGWQAASR